MVPSKLNDTIWSLEYGTLRLGECCAREGRIRWHPKNKKNVPMRTRLPTPPLSCLVSWRSEAQELYFVDQGGVCRNDGRIPVHPVTFLWRNCQLDCLVYAHLRERVKGRRESTEGRQTGRHLAHGLFHLEQTT